MVFFIITNIVGFLIYADGAELQPGCIEPKDKIKIFEIWCIYIVASCGIYIYFGTLTP